MSDQKPATPVLPLELGAAIVTSPALGSIISRLIATRDDSGNQIDAKYPVITPAGVFMCHMHICVMPIEQAEAAPSAAEATKH